MRTQMIDGNSQSDVTAEDLEELSRPPKRTKTAHLFGHCQKVCQDGAKLQRTTAVAFFVSKFVPVLKSRGWDTEKTSRFPKTDQAGRMHTQSCKAHMSAQSLLDTSQPSAA